MASKTSSSNNRAAKSRKSNISRQDIEYYFRKTLNLNKDKKTLRKGPDDPVQMDTNTKMFWKLKKQAAKDSEIYGQERVSDYLQDFDAKTKDDSAAINRISQMAIEEASHLYAQPDRSRANSRMSAKEIENDIKIKEKERRNSSVRFITVTNQNESSSKKKQPKPMPHHLKFLHGQNSQETQQTQTVDSRYNSRGESNFETAKNAADFKQVSLPKIQAVNDVIKGSLFVQTQSDTPGKQRNLPLSLRHRKLNSQGAPEELALTHDQVLVEQMRAQSILIRKRLDIAHNEGQSYRAIGEDLEFPREQTVNSGREQVRTTRDRAARPDGNRHVQRNVLRYKVWQYKPEHFYERQEKVKASKPQDHLH